MAEPFARVSQQVSLRRPEDGEEWIFSDQEPDF
jgi:hypothetical protein